MTLRLRLVGALVLLAAAGLVVFGVGTYVLYSHAQYDRLDDQLRGSRPVVTAELFAQSAALEGLPPPPNGPRSRVVVPPGTFAALYTGDGRALIELPTRLEQGTPSLPSFGDVSPRGDLFTTGSATGSGDWRVFVARSEPDNRIIVIAIPTTEVTDALTRLMLIEGFAGVALLALLAAGSWVIVRRGLLPLEQMATSARSITAGALSQRVTPSDARSEVGQLGLALNTMLGELEQAFAERDATEQRLRQFLADASHELRTPLTSIQGFAELFRLGAAESPDDLAVILRRIEDESARMKSLVDDLMMLARLDQRRPAARVITDLAILAADACSDARAVAKDRPIVLSAPLPVLVVGDVDHLRQGVANLMTNAITHTPPGGGIDVSVHASGDVATLTVRDHGSGLDEQALEQVFDRFWQADAARVGTGSGLGLSIVHSIAREHGGAVVAGNAPGGGAVFTLSLPLAGRDLA